MNGLIPVMLTAFSDDRSVDMEGVDALVDFYLERGAGGLFTVCLSSEMYDLQPAERLALAHRVVRRAESTGSRVPVLATGTFGGTIPEQAEFVRKMADTGVDVVVVLPNQLASEDETDAALEERLDRLLDATAGVELGLYECPKPYHRLLSLQTVSRYARSGRFRYLKETSRDFAAAVGKVDAAGGSPLRVFNAYQPDLLEFLRAGGHGVSPIMANLAPELFSRLCSAFGDEDSCAGSLQAAINELVDVGGFRYPLGAKWYLKSLGLPIDAICRSVDDEIDRSDAAAFAAMTVAVGRILEEAPL